MARRERDPPSCKPLQPLSLLPPLPLAVPTLCYLPGRWSPTPYIVGDAFKPPAAVEGAYADASGHRDRLYAALLGYAQNQARRANVHSSVIAPPPVIPSVPLPVAGSASEQVSRHEGPVRFVRWHPRQAVLASAAASVGVWVPVPPDPGAAAAASGADAGAVSMDVAGAAT